jgi:amidase
MMGDGEISSGGEISAEVTVKVDVIKSKKIEWPLVETKEYTMVIVSADNAVKEASKQAVDLLSKGLGLSWDEAVILASLTVDLKICQLTNKPVTIGAAIPKSIISTRKLIEAC